MSEIQSSEEKFKTSPLGFFMSVFAKYIAYSDRSLSLNNDETISVLNTKAKYILENIKKALSSDSEIKKESSNEAVLIRVIEDFSEEDKASILEVVFEYLNIMDGPVQSADSNTENGKALIDEFYDVTRLGLILNCYLGKFDNDDYFYGTLFNVLDTVKGHYSKGNAEEKEQVLFICDSVTDKIHNADVNLSFDAFLNEVYLSLSSDEKYLLYNKIVMPFADTLLEKIITQESDQSDGEVLACVKQIQRKIERLM